MVDIPKKKFFLSSKGGKHTPEVKSNGCYWADSVKSQRTGKYKRWLLIVTIGTCWVPGNLRLLFLCFTLTLFSLPPFCTWVNSSSQSWFDFSKPFSSHKLFPLYVSTPCFSPVLKHSQQSNISFTWLSRIGGWSFLLQLKEKQPC